MTVAFTVEEKTEVRLEGTVSYKLVMYAHAPDPEVENRGRLGITVSREDFDRVSIGQVVPVRLTFIGSVD